jgi:hypothetical protein
MQPHGTLNLRLNVSYERRVAHHLPVARQESPQEPHVEIIRVIFQPHCGIKEPE